MPLLKKYISSNETDRQKPLATDFSSEDLFEDPLVNSLPMRLFVKLFGPNISKFSLSFFIIFIFIFFWASTYS